MNKLKIGVVSCSGEDCLGGTISRLATRKMLDELKSDETVTICLPLFLAGGEEERGFAETYPTIAVDGCDKCCAKIATEKYSGKVSATIILSDILGKEIAESEILSTRDLTQEHMAMIDKVTEEIQKRYADIFNENANKNKASLFQAPISSGGCG